MSGRDDVKTVIGHLVFTEQVVQPAEMFRPDFSFWGGGHETLPTLPATLLAEDSVFDTLQPSMRVTHTESVDDDRLRREQVTIRRH
jgi:hypothetical protein